MANWFEVSNFGFQEFSAGGVRTFAVVEGQQSAFPIVLLHGTPAASFVWSTTIAAIGRSRRCIALDLPGWGRSLERNGRPQLVLSRESLRKWLSDVVQAQQIQMFDLLGIGDGALLALEFLQAEPQRIRRLGLINTPLKASENRRLIWPWQKPGWRAARLQSWIERESGLPEKTRQAIEPQFRELLSGGWHAERSPEFPVQQFRSGIAGYKRCLREFKGETLLAWGANYCSYDEAQAADFAQGREAILWQEAGHFPMWEQHEAYLTEIVEFFRA